MQWATFIGANGSMGLSTGSKYLIKIKHSYPYIWVKWIDPTNLFGPSECPYGSLEALKANWAL